MPTPSVRETALVETAAVVFGTACASAFLIVAGPLWIMCLVLPLCWALLGLLYYPWAHGRIDRQRQRGR